MGSWGTAIYSNDTASDVRDACRELYGLLDVQEAEKRLFTAFREVLEQDWVDDDNASFWYALSDWQWKHGVLSDSVKEKTLCLLEAYAGLDDWEEAGNKKDVQKRRAVLDKLREQLLTPQPPQKISKIRLAKPKHKVGDLLIFKSQTLQEDAPGLIWRMYNLPAPYMFRSPAIQNTPCWEISGTDLHGKYMAILCVGSIKVPHSFYCQELCDEVSVYAAYDYLSERKPELSDLERCGFLPMVNTCFEDTLEGLRNRIYDTVEWIYKFYVDAIFVHSTFFHKDGETGITSLDVVSAPEEAQRFEALLARKNYSHGCTACDPLFTIMEKMLSEKERSRLTGIPIDNLLEADAQNPELLTPEETTAAEKRWYKEMLFDTLKAH